MGKFTEGFKSVAYNVADKVHGAAEKTGEFITKKVATKKGVAIIIGTLVGGTVIYEVGKKNGKKAEQKRHEEFKKEVIEFCSALSKTEKSPEKEEEKKDEENK